MPIKFKLDPNPTFKSHVPMPIHGEGTEPVEFTFKHRDRETFMDFMDRAPKMDNVTIVLECASGWELADPFDKEHVEKMDQQYLGAAKAVFDRYVDEMTGNAHRLGN